jgi:hypothetical protein
MGIQDRDYMRRPRNDGGGHRTPDSGSGSDGDSALDRFFQRNPRFLLYVSIAFGVLIVITLIVAKISR